MVQDIPGAQTRHLRGRTLTQPLYKYVHDAAADAVLGFQGGREVNCDDAGNAIVEDGHRFLPDFGLAAAATDGAEEGAIGVDDHLGAGLTRG